MSAPTPPPPRGGTLFISPPIQPTTPATRGFTPLLPRPVFRSPLVRHTPWIAASQSRQLPPATVTCSSSPTAITPRPRPTRRITPAPSPSLSTPPILPFPTPWRPAPPSLASSSPSDGESPIPAYTPPPRSGPTAFTFPPTRYSISRPIPLFTPTQPRPTPASSLPLPTTSASPPVFPSSPPPVRFTCFSSPMR